MTGAVAEINKPKDHAAKESLYLAVRSAEERLYTDQEVRSLPFLPEKSPHSKEWRKRQQAVKILDARLCDPDRRLQIMDLGCGNGWLTNRLCNSGRNIVYGVDLNAFELAQANRVFNTHPNVRFYYADVFDKNFPLRELDAVVIASALQYFPDLDMLFARLFSLLNPGGEIHILDTPFYHEEDVPAAQERSAIYYTQLGYPEMAQHYYHHTHESLAKYIPQRVKRGFLKSLIGYLRFSKKPFPYYIIKKQSCHGIR